MTYSILYLTQNNYMASGNVKYSNMSHFYSAFCPVWNMIAPGHCTLSLYALYVQIWLDIFCEAERKL